MLKTSGRNNRNNDKKVNFIYKVMVLTTYMSADTIRNIQNGVNKRKKIHQNAVKKGNKKQKIKEKNFIRNISH